MVFNLLKVKSTGIQGVLAAETEGESPAVVNKGVKVAFITVTKQGGTKEQVRVGRNKKYVFPPDGIAVIMFKHKAELVEPTPGQPKAWEVENHDPDSSE